MRDQPFKSETGPLNTLDSASVRLTPRLYTVYKTNSSQLSDSANRERVTLPRRSYENAIQPRASLCVSPALEMR